MNENEKDEKLGGAANEPQDSEKGDQELGFEVDEDGDIVFPEDEEEDADDEGLGDEGDEDPDGEDDGESDPDEDDEDGEGEEAEPGEEEKSGDAPDNAPAKADKADKPDEEKEALRRELARFKSQTKDTLKKLGVKESDDPLTDLARLAAEANNETLEEYQRKRAEQESADEAQRFMRAAKFEAKMAADLAEVHAAYPSTRGYTSVKQLPNFSEFARLRDLGVSPKQAYIAANPDAVTAAAAESARQRSMNDGKGHLKPAVRKSSKDNSLALSKKDMAMYRDAFPDLSDKEILALYKQANK
jgi:hypothetical protein